MVTCRTYTIEKAPTPGFTLTAGQYEGIGSFNTTLNISYLAGAGQMVRIVTSNPDPQIGDSCLTTDIPLDGNGSVTVPYSVTDTHTIYVIKTVGTVGESCCTSFSKTLCQYSNYVTFTVTPLPDIGSIQFLSNPSGAQIWLATTGQTPVYQNKTTADTITGLLVGNYDYILKLANYNDYISVQPASITKDHITIVGPINLVLAEGCIYFTSSPFGASIFLGATPGTVVDTGFTTPTLICGLDLGQQCYKLILAEYIDKTGCITLGSGQGQTITETLMRSPVLADITISPLGPMVTVGTTRTFSAIPIDQFSEPFPATVTWSSSNTYIGTINPNNGVFSAEHEGSTVITATSGTVYKSTTATVVIEQPVLTTITVSPTTVSIAEGSATILTATKLDQFNNPISATVTWSSSNTNVGTISQNGVFLAISSGNSIITATSGSVSGIAIANVTPVTQAEQPVLTRITISPSTTSLTVGNATIFSALTLDQFNNLISATVTWNSENTGVGTIDQNGIFLAISAGSSTITATNGSIHGVAIANVTQATYAEQSVLSRITISPLTTSIEIGNSAIFEAFTLDQFNNPIFTVVTWESSNEDVGTIDQNGVFFALSRGTSIITATSGSIHGTALANVTSVTQTEQPVLATIIVSPTTVSITEGNMTVFIATKLDQFGNSIYAIVTWSSSNTSIGTISQNGVFLAISNGNSIITATSGSVSGIAIANVTPVTQAEQPVLTRITISPSTTSLLIGDGALFEASTLDQFNNPISTVVTWESSEETVGTIDQNGVFFALSKGVSIIIATSGTITGVAMANVSSSTEPTDTQSKTSLLGNINTAAWILGTAIVGAVVLGKQPQYPDLIQSKPGEEGIRVKIKRLQEKK